MVDVMEETVPVMIHPCPYTKINIDRVFVKLSTVASVFPSGDYKCIYYISDVNDNILATIFTVGSLNSTNKDTFG